MIAYLNDLGGSWIGYFGWAIIQNTLFLALVFLILNRLKGAGAGIKYVICLAGLFKLLLPPFMRMPEILSAAEQLRIVPLLTGPINFVTFSGGAEISSPAHVQLSPAGLLFAIWSGCALLFMFLSSISTVRLLSSLRGAEPVTDEAASRLERRRGVRVYLSDSISMPLTLGIFPRKIFVPASWDRWSPQCRLMVLEHEMAHIDRRDGFVQALQIVVCALYFFHPLVLLLGRRLNEYREMACDDASTGDGRNSSVEYSRYLVEIAESIVHGSAACESASALIRRKNELLNRVRYQIGEGTMRTVSKRKTAAVLAMLVLLVLPLSWYAGNAAPESETSSSNAKVLAVTVPGMPGPGGMRDIKVLVRGCCDEILVDEEKTVLADFRQLMEKSSRGDKDNIVINLVCEDDVSMSTVYQVQYVLRELELTNLNFVRGENAGLPLELPPAKIDALLKGFPESNFLDLIVDDSGGVRVGGKKTESKDVVKAIEYQLYQNPVLIVYIKTSEKTKYRDFLTVLEQAKEAGAERILINAPAKKDI